jgi:hypothetical protein
MTTSQQYGTFSFLFFFERRVSNLNGFFRGQRIGGLTVATSCSMLNPAVTFGLWGTQKQKPAGNADQGSPY